MYYKRKHWLLRLRNIKLLDKINSDKPVEYRSLDVSILNGLVLEKILSLDPQDKSCVTFSPDSEELIGKCDSDNSYVAFFLNSTKIDQVVSDFGNTAVFERCQCSRVLKFHQLRTILLS